MFDATIWFLISFLLHNLEEMVFFKQFKNLPLKLFFNPQFRWYFLMTILVGALGVTMIYFYMKNPELAFAKQIMAGLVLAMGINAIFPHILLSIRFRRYFPGLLSALLAILPLSIFILHGFWQEGFLHTSENIGATILIALAFGAFAFGGIIALHLLFPTPKTAKNRINRQTYR